MAPNPEQSNSTFLKLPLSVVTKVDVGRLYREVESIDNFLKQAAIREPGTAVKMPKTSRLFDETVEVNKINVLHDDERARLYAFLKQIRTDAPILHMSFSADPSPLFTQKLIAWLRTELHPLVLLQIGIQPNIGAGCVVRTNNKYFDFSLRSRFQNNSTALASLLKGVTQ
jgi:G3E family GTPase